MSVKIGFAILSYNEPKQLLRLTQTLTAMFGAPPIVCHHNFSQCPLDESIFPANVRFVHPHIFTKWGHITTPQGAIRAFRLLKEFGHPDWYVLLSGSDYPVLSADKILAELSSGKFDAYLDNREVISPEVPPPNGITSGFSRPAWAPIVYDRYVSSGFWWPRPSRKLFRAGIFPYLGKEYFLHVRDPKITRFFQWYRPARIFAGCFWFQGSEKVIHRLLDESLMGKLAKHFSGRRIPEEGYFHTAICGDTSLRISTDHKRYEDWSEGGQSPKWLGEEDFPKIVQSGAFFARKFLPDGVVQDVVDRDFLGLS